MISLVTVVDNQDLSSLRRCQKSISNQKHQQWEWRILLTPNVDPRLRKFISKQADKDFRIVVLQLQSDDFEITEINDLILNTSANFIGIVDVDDYLTITALDIIENRLADDEEIDFLYTDEIWMTTEVQRGTKISKRELIRKPKISPERLRSHNYIGGLAIFSRELFTSSNGFRSFARGALLFDLYLRFIEANTKVLHVAEPLYFRSVRQNGVYIRKDFFELECPKAAIKVVKDHCRRYGINATVELEPTGVFKLRRKMTNEPLVSIIIPTSGARKKIWGEEVCLPAHILNSILTRTTYKSFEIVLVHDRREHIDPQLVKFLTDNRVKFFWFDKPFNFSEKSNFGAIRAKGEYFIFLNDDTQIVTPDWIELLIGLICDGTANIVGPLTILENGTVQSAGHSHAIIPHNLGMGMPPHTYSPLSDWSVTREISSVTGACLAVGSKDFYNVGGFSLGLPSTFNDVDFCLKASMIGCVTVWTPHVSLYHFESLTRDTRISETEVSFINSRWQRFFTEDEFSQHVDSIIPR
jgi:GT2 family glycosyltransferase